MQNVTALLNLPDIENELQDRKHRAKVLRHHVPVHGLVSLRVKLSVLCSKQHCSKVGIPGTWAYMRTGAGTAHSSVNQRKREGARRRDGCLQCAHERLRVDNALCANMGWGAHVVHCRRSVQPGVKCTPNHGCIVCIAPTYTANAIVCERAIGIVAYSNPRIVAAAVRHSTAAAAADGDRVRHAEGWGGWVSVGRCSTFSKFGN